MNRDQVVYGVM